MKLTQIDLPAPEGHAETAAWILMSELFPMQSLRQSMGTIKGVPRSDGNDTKSLSGVANDSLYGRLVKNDHETFPSVADFYRKNQKKIRAMRNDSVQKKNYNSKV